MENFFTRYRNVTVLLGLLMAQVVVLASQVRRPVAGAGESMSLVRLWVVEIFVPAEKAFNSIGDGIGSVWHNYVDLRHVRAQNHDLQEQVDRLRLEQVSLAEDAGQARRLQALLAFKEKFISQTVAAQVIGTSGSEHSHLLYIDKGSGDGIKTDMAVITPKGIVGKIAKVFPGTSQVLEINDATAGAGVMLERTRLRGVLHGTPSGIPEILHVMADEKIEPGDPVVASGGDQIYPRGLPIGLVSTTTPDPEGGPFMVVKVKPAADLERVEEVLVITRVIDKSPEAPEGPRALRAADILAQRLPTIVPRAPAKGEEPPPTSVLYARKPANATATLRTPKSSSPQPETSPVVAAQTPKPKPAVKPAESETVATKPAQVEPTTLQSVPQQAPPVADQPISETPR
ncbi:MAG TPA: rod shape-determining protein MreC [Terriglobales bacterium]|nr:rod shape-determining protein MreC [Terriglobales bacterium]